MRSRRLHVRRCLRATAAAALISASGLATASADETHARILMQEMSDYMAAQTDVRFEFDTSIDIITPNLEKITFASSGTVALQRPDRIKVTRTGGFADLEMIFDGDDLTVVGKLENVYATTATPGSIDDLIHTLRGEYGIHPPGADLLLSDIAGRLMSDVSEVKDLGSGVVGGVECDHLAFRTAEVDWQIWIAQGEDKYPCRYQIVSKLMAQAPEYVVEVRNWSAGDPVDQAVFRFDNTTDATKVDLADLPPTDEVPSTTSLGSAP